jgi:hypothetical protein
VHVLIAYDLIDSGCRAGELTPAIVRCPGRHGDKSATRGERNLASMAVLSLVFRDFQAEFNHSENDFAT